MFVVSLNVCYSSSWNPPGINLKFKVKSNCPVNEGKFLTRCEKKAQQNMFVGHLQVAGTEFLKLEVGFLKYNKEK